HDTEILGVVGHRQEVERCLSLPRFAEILYRFAHGETEGVGRRGACAEGKSVHRVAGMKVEIAEVGIAERIGRGNRLGGLLRSTTGGSAASGCGLGRFTSCL